uniref:Uncharacterized protein n=1 Tax=Anguilla anguilla TaxID=7936 RepID=A0A0E9RRY3_ANGAN
MMGAEQNNNKSAVFIYNSESKQ